MKTLLKQHLNGEKHLYRVCFQKTLPQTFETKSMENSEWIKFSVEIFLKEGSKRFSKKVDGEISSPF